MVSFFAIMACMSNPRQISSRIITSDVDIVRPPEDNESNAENTVAIPERHDNGGQAPTGDASLSALQAKTAVYIGLAAAPIPEANAGNDEPIPATILQNPVEETATPREVSSSPNGFSSLKNLEHNADLAFEDPIDALDGNHDAGDPLVRPVRVTGIKLGGGLFVSFLTAFFTNVVLFIVGALLVLVVDEVGVLDTVNGLMGSMMKFEAMKLIMLLALFNVVLTVIMTLWGFLSIILFNASSALIGGFKVNAIFDRPKPRKKRCHTRRSSR